MGLNKKSVDDINVKGLRVLCRCDFNVPLKDGKITKYEIFPEQFGLARGTKDEVVGGTPEKNAETTRKILSGEITGTKRNVVLLNAGCAIYVAGKADSIEDGIKKAADMIDSGKALETLNKFVELSNKV